MKNHWIKKNEKRDENRGHQHICVICDSSSLEFYLDGQLIESKSYTRTLSDDQIRNLYYSVMASGA